MVKDKKQDNDTEKAEVTTRKRNLGQLLEEQNITPVKSNPTTEGTSEKIRKMLDTETTSFSSIIDPSVEEIQVKKEDGIKSTEEANYEIIHCALEDIKNAVIFTDDNEFSNEFKLFNTESNFDQNHATFGSSYKCQNSDCNMQVNDNTENGCNMELDNAEVVTEIDHYMEFYDNTEFQNNTEIRNNDNKGLPIENKLKINQNLQNEAEKTFITVMEASRKEDNALYQGSNEIDEAKPKKMRIKDCEKLFAKPSSCFLQDEPFIHSEHERKLRKELIDFLDLKSSGCLDENNNQTDVSIISNNSEDNYESCQSVLYFYNSDYSDNSRCEDNDKNLTVYKYNKTSKFEDFRRNLKKKIKNGIPWEPDSEILGQMRECERSVRRGNRLSFLLNNFQTILESLRSTR
ncbi:hypothetical protein SNEBB_008078 [Seison nebaliae]|nr:hypothetical protein SNEBB_008078 [Seison nebaliae]